MPHRKISPRQREYYEYAVQTVADIRHLVIAGWVDVSSPKFQEFLRFLEDWQRELTNE